VSDTHTEEDAKSRRDLVRGVYTLWVNGDFGEAEWGTLAAGAGTA